MEIHWAQLLGQIVNIFILVWLLNKFLYRPLLKIIDQRNRQIKQGLELAEKNKQEREKILALQRQKLAEAEKKVVEIMQKAKQEASQQARQILEQAQKQAQAEAEKQRRLLMEDLEQEKEKIKQETADLVVKITEKVLADVLDEKRRQEIIQAQLNKIKQLKI